MRYRLAKPNDLSSIVNLHYNVRQSYSVGFFACMRKPFFRQYYKILIKDKNEIILCAEDDGGIIQGFISATLNVEEQFKNLKKHKFVLGLSAITTLLLSPKIMKDVYERYKSLSSKNDRKQFITKEGVRGEFWVWNAKSPNPTASVELQSRLMMLLRALGVKKMYSEVDSINKKIVLFHKLNKAFEVGRITLPDGRERILLCNDLENSGYNM